jgi:hypothetical protein
VNHRPRLQFLHVTISIEPVYAGIETRFIPLKVKVTWAPIASGKLVVVLYSVDTPVLGFRTHESP